MAEDIKDKTIQFIICSDRYCKSTGNVETNIDAGSHEHGNGRWGKKYRSITKDYFSILLVFNSSNLNLLFTVLLDDSSDIIDSSLPAPYPAHTLVVY